MTFEAYARDWLERQNFSKNIRKTTRQSIDYICRAIGSIEISDVAESDVDRIFTDIDWQKPRGVDAESGRYYGTEQQNG